VSSIPVTNICFFTSLLQRTPLNCACYYDFVDTASDLILKGANVNLQCVKGSSPLDWAISKGYSSVVSKLLFVGADLNLKNGDGEAPLHVS
jgi:ankyrin repeat protein